MSERIRVLMAPVQHGVVILRDAESKTTHEWDPSRRTSEARDSVMFAVQLSEDGQVCFEIWRGEPQEHLPELLFDGEIVMRHGELVLADANEDFRITVPGLHHGGRVSIFVDELNYTAKVQIVLRF
jgi:hypothetical protein